MRAGVPRGVADTGTFDLVALRDGLDGALLRVGVRVTAARARDLVAVWVAGRVCDAVRVLDAPLVCDRGGVALLLGDLLCV